MFCAIQNHWQREAEFRQTDAGSSYSSYSLLLAFFSFGLDASSFSFHMLYFRRQNPLSALYDGEACGVARLPPGGQIGPQTTAICVVHMTVWQPYGRPFKTLAGLLNHLYGGHFVVVLIHQTINPLLDSFLSFSSLTL
jgi:hypothetical protein